MLAVHHSFPVMHHSLPVMACDCIDRIQGCYGRRCLDWCRDQSASDTLGRSDPWLIEEITRGAISISHRSSSSLYILYPAGYILIQYIAYTAHLLLWLSSMHQSFLNRTWAGTCKQINLGDNCSLIRNGFCYYHWAACLWSPMYKEGCVSVSVIP